MRFPVPFLALIKFTASSKQGCGLDCLINQSRNAVPGFVFCFSIKYTAGIEPAVNSSLFIEERPIRISSQNDTLPLC